MLWLRASPKPTEQINGHAATVQDNQDGASNPATDQASSDSSANTKLHGEEFLTGNVKSNGSNQKGRTNNKKEGQSTGHFFKGQGC